MSIGHLSFGQKMSTLVQTTEGVELAKVRRKINLKAVSANTFKAEARYTYKATLISSRATFVADNMAAILEWVTSFYPQYK